MSVWGKRVDSWFDARTGKATSADYNRAGLNALWQIALVVLIAVLALLVAQSL